MIIPDVNLSDLAVRSCKWICTVPPNVVPQIPVVTLLTELVGIGMVSALLGIANVGPVAQGAADTDAIIIYLVTSSKPVK